MEKSEDIREAKEIIQILIKAKKNIRLYPENNPIYTKTVDEAFERFTKCLDYRDRFTLQIKQNSISYESEELYYNAEKDDNLALFFFKDGLRELSFKKGLPRAELEEFLKIISLEYDRDDVDDDIVTLLWEKDFQYIQYVVDEAFLVDLEEDDYESRAERQVKERLTDDDDLMRAYTDEFAEDERQEIPVIPLSDKDLQMLVRELEKDSSDKIEKLVSILFELIYLSEKQAEVDEAFRFISDALRFAMQQGNLGLVTEIMKRAKETSEEPSLKESGKDYSKMLCRHLGNQEMVGYLAEFLESGVEIEPQEYEAFIEYLDANAIQPLMHYLGEVKTVRARKHLIDALIALGKRDIHAVARGLDDQRWYVVRNVIYVLRKIGDRRATEYLLRTVRHADIRVRKEGIKALGELGARDVIQTLRECLDDDEAEIRITAARAFGTLGTDVARKIILDKISSKEFREREFDEKKSMFEVLSRWKDQAVYEFLVATIRKKSFFGKAKNDENRACAALALGLLGRKEALAELQSLAESGNDLVRDCAHAAIRKLEYER